MVGWANLRFAIQRVVHLVEDNLLFTLKYELHLLKGVYTVLVLRMAHRIWKETKQEPGTAGPGNMLGCCLIYFHFLLAILSTSTVLWQNF